MSGKMSQSYILEMTIGRVLKKNLLTVFDVGHMANSKRIRKVQCLKWSKLFSVGLQQCKRRGQSYRWYVGSCIHRFYILQPKDPSEKEVQFSHGWVIDFKKSFNIKAYTRHSEDTFVSTSTKVLRRMEEIKTIVSEYDSNDVFNMDEKCIFYKLEPNRTLATMRLYRKKNKRSRLPWHSLQMLQVSFVFLHWLLISLWSRGPLRLRTFTTRRIWVLSGPLTRSVDDYRHFLAIYTRFWEDNGIGTERKRCFCS